MKRHIIYTKTFEVDDLWNIGGFFSAKITGYIYLNQRKFLWWKCKPYLTIKIFTPYLTHVYYDGEYATNDRLKQLERLMRADLTLQVDKIQRKLDRISNI